jgi:hypothetical protein
VKTFMLQTHNEGPRNAPGEGPSSCLKIKVKLSEACSNIVAEHNNRV